MGIDRTNPSSYDVQSGPAPSSQVVGSKADALEAALTDMNATFSSDLVSGRVGQHHNTYEHRTRVLRQMEGRLSVMRDADASHSSVLTSDDPGGSGSST
jgi:hypothetical protein